MSTSSPAAITRPVTAVLPVDEPGEHASRPPVAERDESPDLPEGALAWLAQLQPLPEPLSRAPTGSKEASGAAPKKISGAVPMEAQPQAGAPVQGQSAARGWAPAPVMMVMLAPTLLPTTPGRPLQTTAAQLPAPPGAMGLPMPAVKPGSAVATTPTMQLPVSDVPGVPGRGAAAMTESQTQPVPANAAQGAAGTGAATTPAMHSPVLPVSDGPRVPGSGAAAMAESPAQPVPANAAQGVATTVSATSMAKPGTEPGTTAADGDTPPPQSAQPLPPGLERAARAQGGPPPAVFNPPPAGKPEVPAEKAAQPYLQVPFSKGDCAGVVTVNKASADMPSQLLLSPSNAQVSDHLRDGLEHTPQTLWQLNEQHQQAHDERRQHDADDDEAQGDESRALTRMPAFQGLKP